ncbi:uncharacterized protein LOC110815796 [Carica papaya]|uniref:uncharacterized protein LOC110815796 n=1 Tax=Carica papaya TaxID=3649 RepID=UPI000B8CFCD4|nr:uncharacterized protein LOC110815796 [Carica papaya]
MDGLVFIDGRVHPPADANNPLMEYWLRCNDIVITWLQNTLLADIKTSTLYEETAHELWSELEHRHVQQNAPRVYEVKQNIVNLVQGSDSVGIYYSKLKALFDELLNYESIPNCTCGGLKAMVDYQQRDCVMKFLMGLNESFKGLKAQVLLIKSFPTLNEVHSIIQQEEKRRDILVDQPKGEMMVMMTKDGGKQSNTQTPNSKKYYCSHCKVPGHSLERCFKANPNKPNWSHYGMPEHTMEVCYKLHGYPKGHKLYKGSKFGEIHANQVLKDTTQELFWITKTQRDQLVALLNQNASSSSKEDDSNNLPNCYVSILNYYCGGSKGLSFEGPHGSE